MRPAWIVKLIEAEEEAPIPPPREADRRAAIHAIESAIRMRAQRRSRSRFAYGFAAAAAVLLAAGGGALLARRGTTQVTAAPAAAAAATVSGDGVVVDGTTATTALLAQGGHVAVREGGHATIALPTGTELALGDHGDLGVVEAGRSQIFALSTGSVRARVAKLHEGERFVVRTPDAEVEVRGTVFTVSIVPADSCGTVTRVAVEEGVVVVRRNGVESRVARGERWPADCVATPPTSPAPIAVDDLDEPAAKKPSSRRTTAAATPAASATTSAGSSLAEQNALFSEGLNYKNGGQRGEAIATFEKLMTKYPGSPLAENAAVERMRLLAQMDRARGAAAAQQYLKRYPNGFGRAEAKAIVDSGP